MLYEIAKENKLGFAATKNCEDVNDENYRLIHSKTYVDYINEQLSLSGLDEKSILFFNSPPIGAYNNSSRWG